MSDTSNGESSQKSGDATSVSISDTQTWEKDKKFVVSKKETSSVIS